MAQNKTKEEQLLRQIEFYFGDANLNRDKWFVSLIHQNKNYFVPIEKIMSFNKIKDITTDRELFVKVCEQSSLLMVSADKIYVKRNTPFKRKSKEDICLSSIYMEGFPLDVTVEDIEKQCREWFNTDIFYVDMKKENGQFIGSAVIEFSSPDLAVPISVMEIEGYKIMYYPVWLNAYFKERKNDSFCQVYVKNINPELTLKDIHSKYEHLGQIRKIRMRYSDTKFNGTAFIVFSTPEEAKTAAMEKNITYFPKWFAIKKNIEKRYAPKK